MAGARGPRSVRRMVWIAVGAVLLYGVQWYTGVDLGLGGSAPGSGGIATPRTAPSSGPISPRPSRPAPTAPTARGGQDDIARIVQLYQDERSGVMVEAEAVVERVLRDDNEGSRHQRFILDLGRGQTVLIAHNIDLAPRVPLRAGDRVRFRGQYEWNDRGGVIHWTHHDPQRRREGGWLEHEGRRYE